MLATKEILDAIQKAAETIAKPNCASWLSAIAAVSAVAVAVVVAVRQNKIAKKQNEISERQVEIAELQNRMVLFKERYVVYCELKKIIDIGEGVAEIDLDDYFAAVCLMETIFGIKLPHEKLSSTDALVPLFSQAKLSEHQIKQGIFLFRDIEEDEIDILLGSWIRYVTVLVYGSETSHGLTVKSMFSTRCKQFSNKYMIKMKNALSLR